MKGVIYASLESDEGNFLYAFSGKSGALLWRYRVEGHTLPAFSLVGGIVYFTDGTDNNYLYALDGRNGQLLSKYELDRPSRVVLNWDSWNYSNPTIADGLIYVSGDRILYALNVSGASPLTGPSDLDAQVAIGRAL